MMRKQCLVFALILLLPAPCDAYVDLGLRLVSAAPMQEYAELDTGDRLDLIDELERDWDSLSESDITERELKIAQVYATSHLLKHRVWAIHISEEQPDALRTLESRLVEGAVLERFQNLRAALRVYEKGVGENAKQALAHRELARASLQFGLHSQSTKHIMAAREHFEMATRCADATVEDHIGLCVTLRILEDLPSFQQSVKQLAELGERTPAVLLLSALAAESLNRNVESMELFQEALHLIGPELQQWFGLGDDFFSEQDEPAFLRNSMIGDRPPPSLLRWWVRIIESELFFGLPEAEINGWDTPPGRIFLRYGFPEKIKYFGSHIGNPDVVRSYFQDWNLDVPETWVDPGSPAKPAFWVWVYEVEDKSYPIVFEQFTILAEWQMTARSVPRAAELIHRKPYSLAPRGRRAGFELQVRHAAFRARNDRVHIESYLALLRDAGEGATSDAEYRVTLSVHDEQGAEIDRVQHVLDHESGRGALLDAVGRARSSDATILHQFGADLTPGRYRVTLEVEDLESGEYRTEQRLVDLRAAVSGLELSDIELCDVYDPYNIRMGLPPAFVKYAYAVVPHPERSVSISQGEISLYYEIYGAELVDGLARFDVVYELFPRQGFDPFNAGLPLGMARPAATQRTNYMNEESGQSEVGTIVKGSTLDVGSLGPGAYVLVVSVTDRHARAEAQRFIEFELIAD